MSSSAFSPQIKSQVTDEALVQRRRNQIVGAAVELFSDQGYYRTTVQEVARKAGVSTGLIYQYVEDKEDILLLSILDVIDSYRQEVPAALVGVEDPLLRVRAAIAAYCRVVDERLLATVLTYRSARSLSHGRRQLIKSAEIETNRLISDCLQDCIDSGMFAPVDIEFITYQFVMFAHTWALKHWRLREMYTLDEYVDKGFRLYVTACLSEAGQKRFKELFS